MSSGGRGGLSGWAIDWSKKGIVGFGVAGLAFGPGAAYALASVVATAIGVGFVSVILTVGGIVGTVKGSGIEWTRNGVKVSKPEKVPAPAAPKKSVAPKTAG